MVGDHIRIPSAEDLLFFFFSFFLFLSFSFPFFLFLFFFPFFFNFLFVEKQVWGKHKFDSGSVFFLLFYLQIVVCLHTNIQEKIFKIRRVCFVIFGSLSSWSFHPQKMFPKKSKKEFWRHRIIIITLWVTNFHKLATQRVLQEDIPFI